MRIIWTKDKKHTHHFVICLNKKQKQQIINFINSSYDENIPGPVKFIVKRKVKDIQDFDLDTIPESLRNCTVEELLLILKDAYENDQLDL